MYDISDDEKRFRVAHILKLHGLSRIQRSVFVGIGSHAVARDIVRAINRVVNPRTDIVHIVLIQDHEWERRSVIGSEMSSYESKNAVFIV